MAEGKTRLEWDIASNVLATMYNTAFGAKKRIEPWQCNPFTYKRRPTQPGDISCLKALL